MIGRRTSRRPKAKARATTSNTLRIKATPRIRKDWFDEARIACKASQLHEATIAGNQVIFRLSNGSSAGNPRPYFLMQDPISKWWYLVWDLNTPGGPFHGKYRRPKA